MPRPNRSMHKVNYYLPVKDWQILRQYCALKGTTMAEVVRELVRQYLLDHADQIRDTFANHAKRQAEGTNGGTEQES